MKMRGVWVAMATPLRPNLEIDVDNFIKLAQSLIDAKVHGLFLFGSTGEGPALPISEKSKAAAALMRHVKGKVPVIAGAMQPATRAALEDLSALTQAGVDGVVATPPYFYVPENTATLLRHFQLLNDASSIPLVVYNVPARTNTMLSIDVIRELMKLPRLVGIKDSSLNFAHMQNLIALVRPHRDRFSVTDGAEENWVASILAGADGATLGIANVCPRWCVEGYELAAAGKLAEALAAKDRVLKVRDGVFFKSSSVYGGLKETLHQLGFCGRTVSPPMFELPENERAGIRDMLQSLKPS